jgi:hypothetical protein
LGVLGFRHGAVQLYLRQNKDFVASEVFALLFVQKQVICGKKQVKN